MAPQEVVPGVWVVAGPDLTDSRDCLAYAVDGGSEVALIDCGAGPSAPALLANVRAAGLSGKPLTTLLLTHCHVDHIGGAAEVVRATGARLLCHELDREAVESGDPRRTASSWYRLTLPRLRVDRVLSGAEETVDVGAARLRCLHSPGHTPGSLSVFLDAPAGRVLFGQDVHGPFLPDFGSDEDVWARSMERLLGLRADVLCEGHYGVIRPADEVERFIRHHLEYQGYG